MWSFNKSLCFFHLFYCLPGLIALKSNSTVQNECLKYYSCVLFSSYMPKFTFETAHTYNSMNIG